MIIKDKIFKDNHTYVMGILNITPDSFSDGGMHQSVDDAVKHALKMIEDGADVIDIGGESTRPGYEMISDDEEISRVCPVISKLKTLTDIPISLDTYKSKVAAEGIKCGADMINDIWGLKYDDDMAKVIAGSNVSCCLMHNRKIPVYKDLIEDILSDLSESIRIALNIGIKRDRILIDPGIGFAKSYEENLMVTKHLSDFKKLGFPVLYGASRKSMIGIATDLPKNEREEATIATSVLAANAGCMFVRVHNVKGNVRAIKMTEAVKSIGQN